MGGRRDIQARFPARLCLCLVLGGGGGYPGPCPCTRDTRCACEGPASKPSALGCPSQWVPGHSVKLLWRACLSRCCRCSQTPGEPLRGPPGVHG